MDTQQFTFRGFEFHSQAMWQWAQVQRAIDLMDRLGLTALVFHQNDLVDQLVFPEFYFSEEKMWEINPVRMHTIFNNRHYIAKVIRALNAKGMKFFVEVKELWYPDGLTALHPEILGDNGQPCPFHPFWSQFLKEKYKELLRIFPDIGGVIMSAGTRESRLSVSNSTCSCDHCRGRDVVDWYEQIIGSIYEPLSSDKEKILAVRDFSYSAENQRTIIDAAGRVSDDIVISLKNTPHDYYPPFPHNPSIGNCGSHRQWVEFDGWGQFFGLGVFPSSIVEDIAARLQHCAENGVSGILMRTDWEVITEAGILNSLNMVNLFGFARLAGDPDCDRDEIYREWCSYGFNSPLHSGSLGRKPVPLPATGDWKAMRRLMTDGWKIIEQSQYVRGHLFNEDDQYCNSVKRSFEMMVEIHGRDQWEPGASRVLDITDENLEAIFAEKETALQEAMELEAWFKGNPAGLSRELHTELATLLSLFTVYVKGFKYCAAGVFAAKRLMAFQNTESREKLLSAITDLIEFRAGIARQLKDTEYPHYIYWLLDEKRIDELVEDLRLYVGGEA